MDFWTQKNLIELCSTENLVTAKGGSHKCDEKNNTSLLISWNSKRHVGAGKMVVQLNGGLFIFFKMKGLY